MFDKHLGRKWDVIPSSFKTHYSHWQIERIFDHQSKTTLGYIRKDLCSQLWKLKPLTFWDTPLFRPTLWFEGSIDRPLSSSYSIQYLLSKLIRQSKLALKKLYIYLRIISISIFYESYVTYCAIQSYHGMLYHIIWGSLNWKIDWVV